MADTPLLAIKGIQKKRVWQMFIETTYRLKCSPETSGEHTRVH